VSVQPSTGSAPSHAVESEEVAVTADALGRFGCGRPSDPSVETTDEVRGVPRGSTRLNEGAALARDASTLDRGGAESGRLEPAVSPGTSPSRTPGEAGNCSTARPEELALSKLRAGVWLACASGIGLAFRRLRLRTGPGLVFRAVMWPPRGTGREAATARSSHVTLRPRLLSVVVVLLAATEPAVPLVCCLLTEPALSEATSRAR